MAALAVLILGILTLPLSGNFKLFAVLSGSMEPALKRGSIVFVRSASSYKPGDVVTFKPAGQALVFTHRILRKQTGAAGVFFVTKGDANSVPEAKPISQKEIIGRVVFSLPLLGYVGVWAKTKAGFASFLALAGILAIGPGLFKKCRAGAKNKN